MNVEKSSKSCCCVDNICKRSDDVKSCRMSGGVLVGSCSECRPHK